MNIDGSEMIDSRQKELFRKKTMKVPMRINKTFTLQMKLNTLG